MRLLYEGRYTLKLRLAYDNELELDNSLTHRGRITYIENNILNNKKYIFNETNSHYLDEDGELYNQMTFEDFYNLRSLSPRTEDEEKQIRDRWLGVKRVGSPYADESMKLTLDFVAGYILYAKDHSAKHQVHTFKILKKKELKGAELVDDEKEELGKLEKNIISFRFPESKDDIVFYYNSTLERFLKNRLAQEVDPIIKGKINEKLSECARLRREATKINKVLLHKDNETDSLMTETKELYSKLKSDRKNTDIFNSIKENIHKVRKIRKDIHCLEFELRYLTDDYLQETELQININ